MIRVHCSSGEPVIARWPAWRCNFSTLSLIGRHLLDVVMVAEVWGDALARAPSSNGGFGARNWGDGATW